MSKLSRREFLRNIGLGTAGLTLFATPAFALTGPAIDTSNLETKISKIKETQSICAFCSVGCGVLVYSDGNHLVYIEGDPDHPINQGTICPKGNGLIDVHTIVDKEKSRIINPKRILKPLYRAPGAGEWQEISWDEALSGIAKRVKKTRDETFELVDENGVTVNRTTAINTLGSASLDTEENYMLHKMYRGFGIINIEHHARL